MARADGNGLSSAAERLIDAAEAMAAIHGVEAATDRAITRAAGQRHNSAIQYHFGNRATLFDAVWQRGSEFVNLRRLKLLEGVEISGLPLPALVDVWLRPFAEYLDSRQPSYWARFNTETLRHYPQLITPELRRLLGVELDRVPLGTLLQVLEAMESRTVGGTQPLAALRVSTVVRGVMGTFAAWERERDEDRTVPAASELVDQLAPGCVAFLQAPARG